MSNKNLIVALVSGLVIGAIGYAIVVPTTTKETVKEVVLGAAAGPEHTEHQIFRQNFTQGGDLVATSSTAATYTLTSAELRDEVGYVSWTVNVDTTLTTMASTSEPFVSLKPGEIREVIFYNASTTAGATATFAAGTGVDLQEDEGGTVIVNGLETARITYGKKADSDIFFLVEPYQVGD